MNTIIKFKADITLHNPSPAMDTYHQRGEFGVCIFNCKKTSTSKFFKDDCKFFSLNNNQSLTASYDTVEVMHEHCIALFEGEENFYFYQPDKGWSKITEKQFYNLKRKYC